jgi:hypothetical protein
LGRKTVMKPHKVIDAGDMSGDLTSDTSNIETVDDVAYLVEWSGTSPVGEMKVDVRNRMFGTSGEEEFTSWVELSFPGVMTVSGNSGSMQIELRAPNASQIRLRYVSDSGDGTMNATITGKVGGA